MNRAHPTKAAHCAELLREPRAAADPAIAAEAFGKAFAAALVQPLASLLGGKAPRVTCKLERADASVCVTDGGALAAHFLLEDDVRPHAIVATLGGAAALSLCDRAFGGTGETADPLPETMPMSANLMLDRFGAVLARACGSALGEGNAVSLVRRSDAVARIVPFGRIAECFVLTLEVSEEAGAAPDENASASWSIRLIADVPGLSAWLRAAEDSAPSAALDKTDQTTTTTSPIFGEIDLPLRATLADIKLPLSRLSRLSPGDEIPLPLRRDVPLTVGGRGRNARIIAHGTVGNFDDRAALRLTRISTQGDRP
ncbi:hypothetical protein HME9302_00317 [Alteripontixanthobacter maritimus]|uniref:Flagellar motor switch protein FliN-like C-terminal domain-containing protein n=1 Tax=Alteripontixanthobacter maritimus TaxID=2161824 RepID=A0A369Q3P4_9SPHN|nr:FliM/FliN family flagellar motor C-terminal domain-containing protein [Alteripontixanthobacter maritimus]RDC59132.1 hypothetical protein HME9302_00317 [Alteripontixanthobacter maritimus]